MIKSVKFRYFNSAWRVLKAFMLMILQLKRASIIELFYMAKRQEQYQLLDEASVYYDYEYIFHIEMNLINATKQ